MTALCVDVTPGVIETNLEDYIKFVDGYFQMTVVATDNLGRQATATLIVGSSVTSLIHKKNK